MSARGPAHFIIAPVSSFEIRQYICPPLAVFLANAEGQGGRRRLQFQQLVSGGEAVIQEAEAAGRSAIKASSVSVDRDVDG